MGTISVVDFERSSASKAIKVVALALILAAAALATDHIGVVPSASPVAAAVPMKAEAMTAATVDGFALPANLRPTEADVVEQAPTF